MIAIIRPPKPAFLTKPGNIWDKETQAAIAYYTAGNTENEFNYAAYKNPELKNALKEVFVKCAYCESRYDQVSDGDIEHFRPKGRVNEKNPKSPGYYWLANDWDNLLLSCQHCNQRRTHLLYGDKDPSPAGKLDQFPLKDNYQHICLHTKSIATEEPGRLLLNPCIDADKPESHFSYEETTAAIIGNTDQGNASIRVYALLRPCLVAERNQRRLFLFKQMVVVKRQLAYYNANPVASEQQIFKEELDNLLYYADAAQPYAGMARFFIRKFLIENKIKPA